MSYLIIGIILISLAYIGHYNKKCRWVLFIFMSFVLGYRYEVGMDFLSYKDYFSFEEYYLEPGFNFVCYLVKSLSFDVYDMFYVIAFISLFFISLSLNKKEVRYFPTAVLCFVFTFPFLANGIRQGVSISIFFYAYKFIEERNFCKYAFFIALASLFHYSILIVLPLYFIVNRPYNVYIYIGVYLFSILFIFSGADVLFKYIEQIVSVNKRYSDFFTQDSSTLEGYISLGIIYQLILYLTLLLFSLKCKIHERYPVIFNLFFLAVVLFNLRVTSYLFNRVEIIFSWFQYIIVPIIIRSYHIRRYRQIVLVVMVVAYFTLAIQNYYLDSANHLYPYSNVLFNQIL